MIDQGAPEPHYEPDGAADDVVEAAGAPEGA